MKVYHLMPIDVIVEDKIVDLYDFESKTELTKEECKAFYLNKAPTGKHRVKGKLEFEDYIIPLHQKQLEAKLLRDTYISEDILFEGIFWQVKNDAVDIRNTISDSLLTGKSDEDTVDWRTSDNSWRVTKISDLKKLFEIYVNRKQSVWQQYKLWEEGGMDTPFVVTKGGG